MAQADRPRSSCCGSTSNEEGFRRRRLASELVGKELSEAMGGNTLGPLTFSLFYATDFADQLEHTIIPALRAGFVVLADRYIYTMIARDVVRGAEREWIRDVYGLALVPDVVIYLRVSPKVQAERTFQKHGRLDYWESGLDIQRSGDVYQCFIRYQGWVRKEFDWMAEVYDFKTVDGDREPFAVHSDVHRLVDAVLSPPSGRASKQRAARIRSRHTAR
jgi:dTMP kinase